MDQFLKYFENKKFVRWVLAPTEELNEYWKVYLENNVLEKEQIKLARLLILQLQSKKELNSGEEAIDIFSEIISKLNKKSKKSTILTFGYSTLKYAAVGLFFFFLGITFYLNQKPDQFNGIINQYAGVQDQNNAQLILADGNKVSIPEKTSKIEYHNDGQIVINQKDTVFSDPEPKTKNLNQLVIPFGKNSSIKLPDGTIAYLNAGSRLMYPSEFEGDKREVYLIGEGFFEVVSDLNMPFIVKTNGINVEVLGTKFNLSAYPSDKIIETVLVEGKVELKKTGFHLLKGDFILKPNQRASYNIESAKTEISQVNVNNYIAWHEGYLNFETLELNRVVKKIERYYNIKIRLNDPMLGLRTITGKLTLKEEAESVLNVLANTASVEIIKINKSTYMIK